MNTVTIYGDMHTAADRNAIFDAVVRSNKTKRVAAILSEEVGSLTFINNDEMRRALREKNFLIDGMTLRLARALTVPLIGIDTWENYADHKQFNRKPANVTFPIREANMVKTIERFRYLGNIVVVVGDTHLRQTACTELGPASPIHTTYANDKTVTIIRSKINEIL